MPDTSPLRLLEFSALIARLGPFEPRPEIAVAVSGGGDSMALTLLGDAWARARGGRAIGLTVDHGLRAESGAEARQVGNWLKSRGIEHRILRWEGAKPARAIQARARTARYQLLGDWCRTNAVLHLLLAHHREDQAETYVLRSRRSSGVAGLACMAAIRETNWVRLLRPFLAVPRARLRASLDAAGQPWLDDPSNQDMSYERVRIRAESAARPAAELARVSEMIRRMASARTLLETETALLLARCARPDPSGFCLIDREILAAAKPEYGIQALARVLMCVGGNVYPSRRASLSRLYDEIAGPRPGPTRTLGGCLVTARRGHLVVAPETKGRDRAPLPAPGDEIVWDRRFRVRRRQSPNPDHGAAAGEIAVLGRDGWARLASRHRSPVQDRIPPPARAGLLAVHNGLGMTVIPHPRVGPGAGLSSIESPIDARFWPAQPLATVAFSVV